MMMLVFASLVAAATSNANAAQYSFVSIGDWGGHDLQESTYTKNTEDVAKQLKSSANELDAHFVIGTGDNFYWCGIMNTSDFQVKADFTDVYLGDGSKLSEVPWYHVLGNHEYGYNASAQLDLSSLIPNWHLPARYYTQRVSLSANQSLSLIFLDSSPCISEYRSTDRSGWDPCGTEYPTCSIKGGHDNFEGTCHFHSNIVAQDCEAQLQWFRQQLQAVPEDDWLIVVAHHPADEMDVQDFLGALEEHGGWHLWLNGHAHTLTHYSVDGNPNFVTTGAGSMVETLDQLGGTPGKNRTHHKVHDIPLPAYMGHQYKTIWNSKVAGFTTHTFSEDFSSLTTKFVKHTGEVVHSFVTEKKGSSPSPSPPPPPPPPPTGGCCFYHDTTCQDGQVCCKSDCKDPKTCSYTEDGCSGKYGKVHHCHWTGSTCVVQN